MTEEERAAAVADSPSYWFVHLESGIISLDAELVGEATRQLARLGVIVTYTPGRVLALVRDATRPRLHTPSKPARTGEKGGAGA